MENNDLDFQRFFDDLPGLLTWDEMQEALAVRITHYTKQPLNPLETIEVATINWMLFVRPHLLTLQWFKKLWEESSEEFMISLFENLAPWQKTILQHGFGIVYDEAHPPRLTTSLYQIRIHVDTGVPFVAFPAGFIFDEEQRQQAIIFFEDGQPHWVTLDDEDMDKAALSLVSKK